MTRTKPILTTASIAIAFLATGCTPTADPNDLFGMGPPTGVAADVAAKAQTVAQAIGGTNGFGGMAMDGYPGHMAEHMGFHGTAELAQNGENITLELTNQAGQPCTFYLAFIRSSDGVEEQTTDVSVPAGETVAVQMPCAEIVGIGSLTDVDAIACQLEDGTQFDNRLCVPGFLGSDFACGQTYACLFAPDSSDLDQDGDTQELVAVTSTMQAHMGSGGMRPHFEEGGMMFGGMMSGFGAGDNIFGGMTGRTQP